MRKQLCDALVARSKNPEMVFLTGDLGFMALEPLREAMDQRFINAGVAEQNMVTVAAAMAKQALEVWVYSIAPFCYARPFEVVDFAGGCSSATYIRLGRGEPPKGYAVPSYAPWRQLCRGEGPVVVAVGPLASTYIDVFSQMPISTRPNFWAVAELPIQRDALPEELLQQIGKAALLCVAEEHVQRGSFASELTLYLAGLGVHVPHIVHLHARAHHYERYGSQTYLRRQSRLDPQSMLLALEGKLRG
jgi:transketolase